MLEPHPKSNGCTEIRRIARTKRKAFRPHIELCVAESKSGGDGGNDDDWFCPQSGPATSCRGVTAFDDDVDTEEFSDRCMPPIFKLHVVADSCKGADKQPNDLDTP